MDVSPSRDVVLGTRKQLDRITQMDDTLAKARDLTHGFLNFIRHHNGEGLASWLKDVYASTFRQFRIFARSIERDSGFPIVQDLWKDTPTVSNSICRDAYGRAGLSYLQHRFLPAA